MTARPKVALTMIMRDEAAVLPRLVESVAPHIDSFVVIDTGSTDESQNVLRAAMRKHGIRGQIRNRPWVSFGHNRTELLRLARGKADWLLLMDADWTLNVRDSLFLGSEDCYLVADSAAPGNIHKVVLRGDREWHAVGPVHEYITSNEPWTEGRMPDVTWTHHADGGTRHERQQADLAMLRSHVENDPEDVRSVFYLAQTMREAGDPEAAGMYLRRTEMFGSVQEGYLSYLWLGRLLAAGELSWGYFLRALGMLPDRLEARYELVAALRVAGHYGLAWQLLGWPDLGQHDLEGDLIGRCDVMEPGHPADAMFPEQWIADWGLTFETSIVAYWIGEPRTCGLLCRRLLDSPLLPEERREQVRENLAHAERAIKVNE